MPFNLGMGELILIFAVVLLFFGAKRIPDIAGSFGKGIREFKKNMNEAQNEITGNTTPHMDRIDRPAADAEERPEPKRLM